MLEAFLKIIELSPAGLWESELWSGYPGDPKAMALAGRNGQFTLAQLEEPMVLQGQQIILTRRSVLDLIAGELNPVPGGMTDAVGLRLFEFLTATGVAEKLVELRSNPAGLRTYFNLPSSLAQLPWEFLTREVGKQTERLFLDPRNPISRVHLPFASQLNSGDSVVRVLLVSGQEILDPGSKARSADELRKIRSVFHQAGVSALVHLCEAPESENSLKDCLRDFNPHILHFIGHGTALSAPGSEFELIFRRGDPALGNVRSWRWPASAIYQYFSTQPWKPRLVVLNACHSAVAAEQAASVAESLLDAGIAAVIGAQAQLDVDNAKYFAETFYSKLAALAPGSQTGSLLDVAAVEARQEILTLQNKSQRHWALPVLTVNAPVDQIVRFTRVNTQVMSCEIVREVFVRTGRFVNRAADRWKLISTFQPVPGQQTRPGLIVMGDKRLGKSWLIKRAVRDFLDSGFILTYATLAGKTERSSAHVLADWHGDPGSPSYLRRSIAGPHFAAFERELARTRQAVPGDGFRSLFAEFVRGLQTLRGSRPLLLILDQFDSFSVSPQDFKQGLLQQLLVPMNSGDPEVAGIFALLIVPIQPGPRIVTFDTDLATDVDPLTLQQLIAANRIPEYVNYSLSDLDRFRTLQIPGLPAAEAQNLFDEFSDFRTNALLEMVRPAFVAMGTSCWKGQEGEDFLEQLDGMRKTAMLTVTQPL